MLVNSRERTVIHPLILFSLDSPQAVLSFFQFSGLCIVFFCLCFCTRGSTVDHLLRYFVSTVTLAISDSLSSKETIRPSFPQLINQRALPELGSPCSDSLRAQLQCVAVTGRLAIRLALCQLAGFGRKPSLLVSLLETGAICHRQCVYEDYDAMI